MGGRLIQVAFNGHPYLSVNPVYKGKYISPAEAAGRWLKLNLRKGDVVLVKGSRGVHLERAIASLIRLSEPN